MLLLGAPILTDRDGRCLVISVAIPEYRLEPDRRSEIMALTRDVAAELRGKLSHYA
ncbi:MAG: hypothetical protein ACRDPO_11250 [Streptosporangiaceae bacterium]